MSQMKIWDTRESISIRQRKKKNAYKLGYGGYTNHRSLPCDSRTFRRVVFDFSVWCSHLNGSALKPT